MCVLRMHRNAFSFFLEIRVEANSYSPLSKRMIRLLDASHSAGDGFNEEDRNERPPGHTSA